MVVLCGATAATTNSTVDGIYRGVLTEASYRPYVKLVEFVGRRFSRAVSSIVATCFIVVLSLNLIGLFPYAFTVTSMLLVVVGLTTFLVGSITVVASLSRESTLMTQVLPTGSPLLFTFLLVPLEIVGYLARPLSLAIRLGTNMICGHTLIKLILKLISFLISCGS